ncbi:MAG: Fic family protein [Gammaproteobacteria bacterium]|nr:Fic family protein [Gammaproteobacteria bacterium]
MFTPQWIWQQEDWPNFTWQEDIVQPLLRHTRLKQGILLGTCHYLSQVDHSTLKLETLSLNIIASSAIEDESLNVQLLRSSLARRLNIVEDRHDSKSKRSEGLVEIMLDAVTNLEHPLTRERLFQWHQWIFIEQDRWAGKIRIGELRVEGMEVVSGLADKPIIHFQAPDSDILDAELDQFIEWFNRSQEDNLLDPLLRAAITHLWFVTLHSFDDGNGRITRALTDLALAQAEPQSIRFYAMPAAIFEQRKDYYRILEQSQRGKLDITDWVVWFLQTLDQAIQRTLDRIQTSLIKAQFWQRLNVLSLSQEQLKVLNLMLEEEQNEMSTSQYQTLTNVSKATAKRHLADLLEKGCIKKLEGEGRNTRYQIAFG